MYNCYVRLLAHRPLVVLAAAAVVTVVCTVLVATLGRVPDFSDPSAGFTTRSTPIQSAFSAWENLVENTAEGNEPGKLLTAYPKSANVRREESYEHYDDLETGGLDETVRIKKGAITTADGIVCEFRPDGRYARLVFASTDEDRELLTVSAIHSMCLYERDIRSVPAYVALWLPGDEADRDCGFLSLSNYVALLANASDCMDVSEVHIERFKSLLNECVPWYRQYSMRPECWHSGDAVEEARRPRACNRSMPLMCQRMEVFQVYRYIVDSRLNSADPRHAQPIVRYAVMFLPLIESEELLELYEEISAIHCNTVAVVAAEFGLKHSVFRQLMLQDTLWIGIAALVVFVVLLLYTSSVFITCTAIVGMAMALVISYFLYQLVFGIEFFPFVNLLTVVVVVGIGADDLLIFSKIWTASKDGKETHVLEKIVETSLTHGGASMLVTSLTTAGAFYAGAFTHVIALRCFCIYAGTTILLCYVIAVTWIPASFVVNEKWSLTRCCRRQTHIDGKVAAFFYKLWDHCMTCLGRAGSAMSPKICYIWLVLLTACGVGGMVCIFYWPKFKLPSSNAFYLLPNEHLFEVYDADFRSRFDFESPSHNLPLYFVWGIKPVFNGDYFDLDSTGVLEFDPAFNLSSKDAQVWLKEMFCFGLRESSLVISSVLPNSCFIEDFSVYLEQQTCNSSLAKYPCCRTGDNEFPYEPQLLSDCLAQWSYLSNVYRPARRTDPGVRYFANNGSVAAIVLMFFGNHEFSFSHESTKAFYSELQTWFTDRLLLAPAEMRGGFVTCGSDLLFFDLQESISLSVSKALLVSTCITVALVFLCTLNPLLLAFSMVTIAFIMSVTLGSLLLLGWELNILESVVVSLAIGLSMDYTLHYVVAYRLSSGESPTRQKRVSCALQAVGSGVSCAALTTFLAGVCMLPAGVLAYRQLGVFMTIVSSVSWIYSHFYLLSLLYVAGPQQGFMQLRCSIHSCWTCVARVCCDRQDWREHYHDTAPYSNELPLSSVGTSSNTVATGQTALSKLGSLLEEYDSEIENDTTPVSYAMARQ